MRFLQLCSKPPMPLVDGGTIATNEITQALLEEGHTVNILTIETPKHPFLKSKIPTQYQSQTQIQSVYIDTTIKPWALLKDFLFNENYIVNRFVSNAFSDKLIEILKQNIYDCIILEGLFVAPYVATIRQYSQAKIILRAHNIEFEIWERVKTNSTNLFKKFYLRQLIKKLREYEIQVFDNVDYIAAISSFDLSKIKQLSPKANTHLVELSTAYTPNPTIVPIPHSIGHLAAMDWQPNVEGVEWFLQNVWPIVHQTFPEAKLNLAGRHMPSHLLAFNGKQNTTVQGTVDNAEAFLQSKAIVIAPLLSGSGVRVKIIEAMAMGKAIVCTPQATQGLECTHNLNIVVAATPQDFANQIIELLNNPEKVKLLGQAAASFINQHHRRQSVAAKLVGMVKS